MRFLPIFLTLAMLLVGVVAAQDTRYPQDTGMGVTALAHGGGASYLFSAVNQTIAAAESSDDDQLFAAIPANNTTHILVTSTGVGSSTFLAAPDVPRNIIATPSGSATGSLKLTGTDISGTVITSNLTFAGAGVIASTKAFKTVTRLDGTFTQTTPRTFKIGTGDLLGLNQYLPMNTVLVAYLDGVREGTAPAVTTSLVTLGLNTIDTSGAPAGKVTSVLMLVPA